MCVLEGVVCVINSCVHMCDSFHSVNHHRESAIIVLPIECLGMQVLAATCT